MLAGAVEKGCGVTVALLMAAPGLGVPLVNEARI
jgi:hypothetical protein